MPSSRLREIAWSSTAMTDDKWTCRSAQRLQVQPQIRFREAAEDHLGEAGLTLEMGAGGFDRDLGRGFDRIAVDAGADRREGDRFQGVRVGEFEGAAVAGGEQFGLAGFSVLPDRPDGVDDMPGRQAIALGDLRVAGLAAVERAALSDKLRSGGTMDRAIDPAATEQRGVGGIDDGIDFERDDVG